VWAAGALVLLCRRAGAPRRRGLIPTRGVDRQLAMDVPVKLGGSVTIVVLVVFGIFLYPWLLKHRGGALAVVALTAALTALFHRFDRSDASFVLAFIWASLPALTGFLVHYFRTRGAAKN
jgi:hypothetical protein